jgi:hypothetical protein
VGKGGGRGKGEEMTQKLYAHMNKRKKNLKRMLRLYRKSGGEER